MDLRRLEVFCRVAELRNFSRAAERVRLAQPTVSEHIRLLEEEVGERLLDRLGREVLPTPAGEILLGYARRMLQLRDEAQQAIADYCGTLAGGLVLGASTIPGAYLLPSLIEAFHGHHSACRITLRISGSERILQEVVAGGLAMGIVGAPPAHPGVEGEELFSDQLQLAVWPGHPLQGRSCVTATELAGYPFILREPGSGTRQIMEQALLEGGLAPARLSVVAEMGSSEAVRECIKGRLGISFLSSLALREDLERGTLIPVPLKGVALRRSFFLIRRRGRQLTPLGQAFLDHLRRVR